MNGRTKRSFENKGLLNWVVFFTYVLLLLYFWFFKKDFKKFELDSLQEIITTLSVEDQKEFRLFINRQKQKRDRKDLQLFDSLLKQPEAIPDNLAAVLYPEGNAAAYHALRKRLHRHLMDFIMLKRVKDDSTSASSVMGHLSLARYLLDHGSDRLAWKFLRKAEKQAQEAEHYDLLNAIYNVQIEHADSEFADDLDAIIPKRNTNKQLADEDERANIAYGLIRRQLYESRLQGKAIDFDKIIHDTLERFELAEAVSQRPGLFYKLMFITRSAILAKKDFHSFEPFIIHQYEQLERTIGFGKPHHFYKLSLLYMVAHVLYRNKQFDRSNKYLWELYQQMQTFEKTLFQQFFPRYSLLIAANYSLLGKSELAITELEELLKNKKVRLKPSELLNAQLNLGVYLFQQERYKEANRILINIGHSDKWCEKKMGKEWVLRKNMVELVVLYDLGKEDLAENRLRSIERNFAPMWDNPIYSRVKNFLVLIRQFMHNPEQVTSEAFMQKVYSSTEYLPNEREDLVAIGFYAWLKSKMKGEKYYPVLLGIMQKF